MRKGKFFTPKLLDKWEYEQGRGTGTFSDYVPWHQVTRSDPSSRGRSHLAFSASTNRLHHHLSDGERLMFGFAKMIPGLCDIREQFKLETSSHFNALHQYSTESSKYMELGTVGIAKELGIKNPELKRHDQTGPWRFSTDLLLTCKTAVGLQLIAVAYKPEEDLLSARKRDLLRIEQEYWRREGATWLLITPRQYSKAVASTVKAVIPWIQASESENFSRDSLSFCADLVKAMEGDPLSEVLMSIKQSMKYSLHQASSILYKSIWQGMLPLDLSRSHRITDPIKLLSIEKFWAQNPIAARRTACL